MKLISLHIDNYKLFKDFKIDFPNNESVVAFIGKNGAGKTTLIESLVLIFSRILSCKSLNDIYKLKFPFNFKIQYLLRTESITETSVWSNSFVNYYALEIEYNEKTIITLFESENKHDNKSKIEKYLKLNGYSVQFLMPSNLSVYYSGISNIILKEFNTYQKNNILGSLDGDIKIDQPFYYFKSSNFPIILTTLLSYQYGDIPEKLKDKFSIEGFEKIEIKIKKPKWAKSKANSIEFWGAKGDLKQFLTLLKSNSNKVKESNTGITFEITNINSLFEIWSFYGTEKRLFDYLVALEANDLLSALDIYLIKNGISVSNQRLSEGEKQRLIIYGLSEFSASDNSIMLLDEPDTYLHPEWKQDFIYDLNKSSDLYKNYTIITSHSPDIVSAMKKEQLFILRNVNNKSELKTFSYNPFGKEVDNLLFEVFDVENIRYKGVQKQINELWTFLKENKYKSDDFNEKFNLLKKQIGQDDNAITQINIEIIKRNAKNQ